MKAHETKIDGEGLTYDDVLLIPNYSEVLPREVSIQSKFSRNITLNVPIISAAMDTVTESSMAIAMAQEGGIGVLHKNMTIEQQAAKVRKVKRAESGMIIDPVTLPLTALVADAKNEAQVQGQKMIEQAKAAIESEKNAAMAELKLQVSTLSLSIAEKVLRDELSNKEAQTKLVEKMLGDAKLN